MSSSNFIDSNFRTFTSSDLNGQDDPLGGHRAYGTLTDGSIQIPSLASTRRGRSTPKGNPTDIHLNGFTGESSTRNYSVYLRDSWQIGWGLILNPRRALEGQELYASDGTRSIDIKDNWAPRRHRLRLHQPDQPPAAARCSSTTAASPVDPAQPQRPPVHRRGSVQQRLLQHQLPHRPASARRRVRGDAFGPGCDFSARWRRRQRWSLPLVAPASKGQFINEFVVGINYDVGLDIVLRQLIHRDLGNIIEGPVARWRLDLHHRQPGVPTDPALVQQRSRTT